MNIFQVSDILEFAVRIEEDGEQFYRRAAQQAEDREGKKLFAHLADAEIAHKKVFQDMLQTLAAGAPAESYEGEYLAYLREFIDGKIVFSKEKQADLAAIRDTLATVNFALQRELDSITFYQETKLVVPENRHNVIDRIIAEERQHVLELSKFKRDYIKQVDG